MSTAQTKNNTQDTELTQDEQGSLPSLFLVILQKSLFMMTLMLFLFAFVKDCVTLLNESYNVPPTHTQNESTQCITVNSLRFSCLHSSSCLGSPCPHRWQCSHTHRYHTDFGLGMMLKGGGNVPPSSK